MFDEVLASSAKSVVETQVEAGNAQIYQSVETTVNGKTIKKESNQPGKLELEMTKTGEGKPTVTFFEEPQEKITPALTSEFTSEVPPSSFVSQIIEFVRNFFSSLTSLFK